MFDYRPSSPPNDLRIETNWPDHKRAFSTLYLNYKKELDELFANYVSDRFSKAEFFDALDKFIAGFRRFSEFSYDEEMQLEKDVQDILEAFYQCRL